VTSLLKPRSAAGDHFAVSEQIAQAIEPLTVAVAKLRSENNFLRRKAKLQPHVRVAHQAGAAARLLALWHCTGYRTGRRAALSFGMSDRTWFHAKALCMVARIHDGNQFTTTNPTEIEQALAVAVQKCERDPNTLILRLPASRKPKRRV